MKKESKGKSYLELVTLLIAIFGTIWLFSKSGLSQNLKPQGPEEKAIMFGGIILITFVTLGVA